MMIARALVRIAGLLFIVSVAARAQGIPRISVALEGGDGPHTMQAGATYFRDEHSGTSVLAATIRLWQWGRVAPVFRAEREIAPRLVNTSDCPLAPNGSCREHFRQPEGMAAGGGAMVALTRWLTAGASVGRQWTGVYTQDFTEVRAVISPWKYVGVSGAIRRLTWDDPEHGRLWHRLRLVGVQLQLP